MDQHLHLTHRWQHREHLHKISNLFRVITTSIGQAQFNTVTQQLQHLIIFQVDHHRQLKISTHPEQHRIKHQIFLCQLIIFFSKGKRSPTKHRYLTSQQMISTIILTFRIISKQMPCQAKLVKTSKRSSAHQISTPFKQIRIKKTIIDKR